MNHADVIKAGYVKMISKEDREEQRNFNRKLKNYKFFVAHPYLDPQKNELSLVAGFGDKFTDDGVDANFEVGDKAQKVFKAIQSRADHISGYSCIGEMTGPVIIPTSDFTPFDVGFYAWDDVAKLPAIEEAQREVLERGYLEMFGYLDDYEREEYCRKYFYSENKIPFVELRTVWKDVDSYGKYGNINTLIIWAGKMIGHVSQSGRYLDTYTYFVHDAKVWKSFMDYIDSQILAELGAFESETSCGAFVVIDPTDSAEEWISIAGVSTPLYKEGV